MERLEHVAANFAFTVEIEKGLHFFNLFILVVSTRVPYKIHLLIIKKNNNKIKIITFRLQFPLKMGGGGGGGSVTYFVVSEEPENVFVSVNSYNNGSSPSSAQKLV